MNELARIAKILEGGRLVINRGAEHGVTAGAAYLVYQQGDEIHDPETGDSLGHLEIVKGRAVVTQVQAKLSVLSLEGKAPERQLTLSEMMATLSGTGEDEDDHEILVEVGDFARLLQED